MSGSRRPAPAYMEVPTKRRKYDNSVVNMTTEADGNVAEDGTIKPNITNDIDEAGGSKLLCSAYDYLEMEGEDEMVEDDIIAKPREILRSGKVMNQKEINTIRVIGQYLRDMGMLESVETIVAETGVQIEDKLVVRLRENIINGCWNKCLEILPSMNHLFSGDEHLEVVRILLLEEKLKELIFHKDYAGAFRLLHGDYPTSQEYEKRREYYACLIMGSNEADLEIYRTRGPEDGFAEIPPNRAELLEKVQQILPIGTMLENARLSTLLDQSLKAQIDNCEMHINTVEPLINDVGYLQDHHCSARFFPTISKDIIVNSNYPLLHCLFSPCGKYIAVTGKTRTVYVHEINKFGKSIKQLNWNLPQDANGGAMLSWSKTSAYIAVAALETGSSRGVFIYSMESKAIVKHIPTVHNSKELLNVVSFFPNSDYRLAIGDINGHFYVSDFRHSNIRHQKIDGYRIRSLKCLRDNTTVLASDTHERIRRYNVRDNDGLEVISDHLYHNKEEPIVEFSVDRDEKNLIITTKNIGILLFNINLKQITQKFLGASHSSYLIYSSFGGPSYKFIASGSEDSKVVIWNKNTDTPTVELLGHSKMVNAVSWNPLNQTLLASCSDDGSVRIWGPENEDNIVVDEFVCVDDTYYAEPLDEDEDIEIEDEAEEEDEEEVGTDISNE
uniref:LisH domain-containing protein n=1 Tax=Rhabditophanes sp. KR3021 TaxID=114890 RepID=A0AC35U6N5_9BILA